MAALYGGKGCRVLSTVFFVFHFLVRFLGFRALETGWALSLVLSFSLRLRPVDCERRQKFIGSSYIWYHVVYIRHFEMLEQLPPCGIVVDEFT